MRSVFCTLISLFIVNVLSAQVTPVENSLLHYRLIGISFPAIANIDNYQIDVADGYYSAGPEFDAHITSSYAVTTNRQVIEVASFNQLYTWRITYKVGNKSLYVSELHHFKVLPLPQFLGRRPYRLRVLKQAEKYKDAYVFTDKNHTLYDMKGHPVWFLPNVPGKFDESTEIRNLRISHRGTITFTTFELAYEINYDGQILWESPNDGKVSGDNTERYHHQLSILPNNDYMVLGTEMVEWNRIKSATGDSVIHILTKEEIASGMPYKQTPFGTIIEYDTNNNVVWSWKSSDYYKEYYTKQPLHAKSLEENHENAFFFDNKNKYVYLSYKNTSQVIKIRYPDGIVTNVYGRNTAISRDATDDPSAFFCNQHSCKISKKGYLFLFNNNFCNDGVTPSVLMLKEPANNSEKLQKVWEYTYPYSKEQAATLKDTWTMGGNVIEMPGSEIFVSMCLPYGNLYIISLEKKLLWDALLECWNPANNTWERQSSYRGSIINERKKLENVVWSQEIAPTP